MLVKAELKNYRQSPRKVRLVANLIKGKKVDRALMELNYLDKKAAPALKKLIDSAVANAKHNFNLDKESLVVKEMRVDEGIVMKRWMPGARGRAFPFKRRNSHVVVTLEGGDKETAKKETKSEKKTVKKAVKPKTTKK